MKKFIGLLLLLALPLLGQASDPPRMKIDSTWSGYQVVHPDPVTNHWQIDTTYWIETEHGYTQVIPRDVLFPSITETIKDSTPAYTDSVLWEYGKRSLILRTYPMLTWDSLAKVIWNSDIDWNELVDSTNAWDADSIIKNEID